METIKYINRDSQNEYTLKQNAELYAFDKLVGEGLLAKNEIADLVLKNEHEVGRKISEEVMSYIEKKAINNEAVEQNELNGHILEFCKNLIKDNSEKPFAA